MTSATPTAREPALVDTFVALADTLLSDGRGQLQVMAYSTEEVRLVELLQLQAQEGPCFDCFHTGRAVSAPDLTETADRWPQFAPSAAKKGFSAVQSSTAPSHPTPCRSAPA
jgi:hypothetical protein